jgi:hypothetical protein
MAVGLRLRASDIDDIAGWIQWIFCAEKLDVDLELRR